MQSHLVLEGILMCLYLILATATVVFVDGFGDAPLVIAPQRSLTLRWIEAETSLAEKSPSLRLVIFRFGLLQSRCDAGFGSTNAETSRSDGSTSDPN